jgi:ATP-binding protein involved in chromosome partitioning
MSLKMFQEDNKKNRLAKNVIAIAAGKGGVGKSTVAVQLAHALTKRGNRVGILDADVYGPSIRRMMPEDRLPGKSGDYFTPGYSAGVAVMTMGYFRGESDAAAVRAPIANRVIGQFLKEVSWGELDYLLIDFPPGTGDIQLTLAQEANLTGAVMVTTPQQVSVMDVKKAMKLFGQVKVPILGVVENMSYLVLADGTKAEIFGSGGGKTLAEESGVPFLGQIAIDPELCRSCDIGESLFNKKGTRETCVRFFELADRIVKEVIEGGANGSEINLVWQNLS